MRAQFTAYLLLGYAVTCWLVLFATTLIAHLAGAELNVGPSSLFWILPLALLPVFLVSVMRRGRIRRIAQVRWEEADRSNPAELLSQLLWSRAHRVALGEQAYYAKRLLVRQGLLRKPLRALDSTAQRVLLDLLTDHRISPAREDLLAGARLLSKSDLPVTQRLRLWNRVEAEGYELDPVVDDLLELWAENPVQREGRFLLPLLFACARSPQVSRMSSARLILVALLNARRLGVKQVPGDLREPLLGESALAPSIVSRIQRRVLTGGQGLVLRMVRNLHSGLIAVYHLATPKRTAVTLAAIAIGFLVLRFHGSASIPEGHGTGSGLVFAPQPGDTLLRYTVQVMASRDAVQATALADSLRIHGYWSYVLGPRPNSSWYRVRLGAFRDRAPADSLAQELKSQMLIDAWYVANFDTSGTVHGAAVRRGEVQP